MTAPTDGTRDLLVKVLAALTSDYWLSRETALHFLVSGDLDEAVVDAIWREYWGRGIFDAD